MTVFPARIPTPTLLRVGVWIVTTVLAVAGGWYSLKARVDTNESAITEIRHDQRETARTVEGTNADIKVVIQKFDDLDQKLDGLDKRMGERLSRIEDKQDRGRR